MKPPIAEENEPNLDRRLVEKFFGTQTMILVSF
jgi:hypothetical protein